MDVFTVKKQEAEPVQLKLLWSLAALYGSIVIGWIAYQNYQPKLLDQFHFSDFSLALMIAQGIFWLSRRR